MKSKIQELLAVCVVVVSLIAIPIVVWWYENNNLYWKYGKDAKIIKLTATAKQGRVTLARVDGLNYWSGKFPRLETIKVNKGEKIVLVIKSADVTHSFRIRPELNVEQPIEMEGGHTKIVVFTAEEPGSYFFECSSFCGCAHHAMYFKIDIVETPTQVLYEGNFTKGE